MPSPFPGMDPYLEDHALWPDVHSSLITYIREELQAKIRPSYVARIGERIELAQVHKGYIPDVSIVKPPRVLREAAVYAGDSIVDEPQTHLLFDEERRVPYIEIIQRETGEVVTLIEVLSSSNKIGDGREQYLQKQADLLATPVSLVEIDLLREGKPTTLARQVAITQPPDWRYVVSVSRGGQRNRLEVYPFGIRDRLPRCRIPLRSPDPDVVLDLPAVFARCYDVGGYDLTIDYTKPPPGDLSEEELTWLRSQLDAWHAAASQAS
ncbi:MAG: hypothetical protein BroJett021_00120 [Chloroflexota bacterium]|nr:DUF4058 family protein [Caldilinea sp.]GIK71024.1 MAG: hypothetical protein BroJett021_00120 [Chloroflexota bacterium]